MTKKTLKHIEENQFSLNDFELRNFTEDDQMEQLIAIPKPQSIKDHIDGKKPEIDHTESLGDIWSNIISTLNALRRWYLYVDDKEQKAAYLNKLEDMLPKSYKY